MAFDISVQGYVMIGCVVDEWAFWGA